MISLIFFILFSSPVFAIMTDYCSSPPFLTAPVKSNVLLVMDFSGSMQFPAYYSCRFHGYYGSKVAMCGYDGEVYADYNPDRDYYGYFDPDKYYKYNPSGKYWEENPACRNTDRIGKGDCISGNLLNWILMTRIDAALKALIGGKADCDTDFCYLRPQGSRRYVRSSNLHCKFYIRPESYSSGTYSTKDILISVSDYGGSCAIGTFSDRYARVKVERSQRKGIIQNNFELVRFGFMVFASDGRYGEIRYGFNEEDLDLLISKIQNEVPYYGTPTGEALWEAYDYLKQSNEHYYESNSLYIRKGTSKDPYYEELEDGSVVPVRCRKNFVVLISDGEWNGEVDPVKPAYYMHTGDLRSDLEGEQTAKIFSLFAFSSSRQGEQSMKTISAFGSFEDISGCTSDWPYTFSNFPENSRYVSFPRSYCDPSGTYRDCCREWDKDRDGIPDTYFSASSGEELQDALTSIFREIVKEASSGSAVAVLSKQAETGSCLLQAVFYPEKRFGEGADAKKINWIGYLYNWWLYTGKIGDEPISNIREDTIQNKALDICEEDGSAGGDYIMEYLFEDGKLKINAFKSDISGQKAEQEPSLTYEGFDQTHPVWEAGEKLCLQEDPLSRRKIYVYLGNLEPSSSQTMSELKSISYSKLFGDDDLDGIIDEEGEAYVEGKQISFEDLKNYIYGIESSGYRRRETDQGNTWRLSDIIYSTPKTVNYDNFSVVFVGANDGMLHAFRLGKIRYDNLGVYQQAKLRDSSQEDSTERLAEELWSFIPKNSLPYLRFLADPDYCHLYYVDLSPYIIEVDLNRDRKPDKRILIGGMRFGGAVGCPGCINPPKDTCPDPSSYDPENDSCIGLSSYFALDITDPESPKFLWEFTNPDLGFTYSGPAFIKRKDSFGNWHYYIMFLSGPTDYRGESSQDLRIFILEVDRNFSIVSKYVIDGNSTYSRRDFVHITSSVLSSFRNSFGGRLFTEGIDYDEDGNTDMVFFGITKRSGTKWQGNVVGIRIADYSPLDWEVFKVFTSATKPVTAKIEYMKCFNMNYIFFGTGRYFFKQDDPGQNQNDREVLYGIRIDRCLEGGNCNISYAHSSNESCSELMSGNRLFSWYQELNPKEDGYFKERNISDPSVSDQNVVFFSTTEPTSDLCGFGGRSRIWMFNCATGESLKSQSCPPYIVQQIKGTAYLHTSVGKISQYPIVIIDGKIQKCPFTEEGGKATSWTSGITPESPTPFCSPSTEKSKKGEILYWIEH